MKGGSFDEEEASEQGLECALSSRIVQQSGLVPCFRSSAHSVDGRLSELALPRIPSTTYWREHSGQQSVRRPPAAASLRWPTGSSGLPSAAATSGSAAGSAATAATAAAAAAATTISPATAAAAVATYVQTWLSGHEPPEPGLPPPLPGRVPKQPAVPALPAQSNNVPAVRRAVQLAGTAW